MRRRHTLERENEHPNRLRRVTRDELREAAQTPPSPTEGTAGHPGARWRRR